MTSSNDSTQNIPHEATEAKEIVKGEKPLLGNGTVQRL